MTVSEKIEAIIEEVHAVNPECLLVAATKTRTIDEIREAMNTGLVLAAGENKVQELVEKYVPEFRWDFIGQLQTNKVKYIIDKVDLIHSVDRLSLAETIEKESVKHKKITDVLMEINSGREESKGGIFLEEAFEFAEKLAAFPHIRLRGIMAVAPAYFDERELRNTFDEVYSTFQKLKTEDFCYLSMGMSNDYMSAVKSGANLIRLGRAVFGERIYNTAPEISSQISGDK